MFGHPALSKKKSTYLKHREFVAAAAAKRNPNRKLHDTFSKLTVHSQFFFFTYNFENNNQMRNIIM